MSAVTDKLRRIRYKQSGLCIDCGKPSFGRFVRCVACLYKYNLRQYRYSKNHPDRIALKTKNDRVKRIEEGRCVRCGRPLWDVEGRYCIACLTMNHQPKFKGIFYETITTS